MAEQRPLAPHHQHDDRRVGAGKMLGSAVRAGHDMACAARRAGMAAHAAEAVPRAPMHHRARMGEHGSLRSRQGAREVAQVFERATSFRQECEGIFPADFQGKTGLSLQQAEKDPGLRIGAEGLCLVSPQKDRLRVPLSVQPREVPSAPDRHEQTCGILESRGNPCIIVTPFDRAIERAAGIEIRTRRANRRLEQV